MKVKNLLGGLLMAILGAVIALFAYTQFIDNSSETNLNESSNVDTSGAAALLTAFQMQEGQVDFTYAAQQTVHGVVHVRTKTMVGQPDNPVLEWFYGDQYRRPREVSGYGSGVIISADGYIITNNHVIENAETVDVKLNDNRTYTAKVVGRDPSTDIALLKVEAENLPYVRYGDSDQLKLGEWVLAVGNPFNLTSTVTAGIVSAKGRSLGILDADNRVESFIQTDAALNMGNSGGALVNTKGMLVGITSAILSPSGAYAGNSFAIPVNIVKKIVADLTKFGEVQRAIIGINMRDVTYEDAKKQELKDIRGVFITNIVENSAAMDAGLQADDIITSFNGVSVNTSSELQEQVGKFSPGDKASVTYLRRGVEKTVPLVLRNIAGNTSVVTAEMGSGSLFGAKIEPLGSSEKRSYDLDYGVKITDLGEGKFRDIGMQTGNIILSINGRKVNSSAEVREATSNGKSLRSIEGVQKDGTMFSYQFRN
jgi:Do/DeqQ family serine protease